MKPSWLLLWLALEMGAAGARPEPEFFHWNVEPSAANLTVSLGSQVKTGSATDNLTLQLQEEGLINLAITAPYHVPYERKLRRDEMLSWKRNDQGVRVCPDVVHLEPTIVGFLIDHPMTLLALGLGSLAIFAGVPKLLQHRRERILQESLARRRRELMLSVDMSRDPLLGQTVGQYYLADRLGVGGMATVYKAVPADTLDESRALAMKIVRMDRDTPEARERFSREARITMKLNHPNVVRLLEIGGEPGFDYFLMELVDGRHLQIPPRGMPLAEAKLLIADIFEGLCYAHERGIVHRDLKPENIMVTSEQRVKLLDFGLARTQSTPTLTGSGFIVGTPAYLAPEQITGSNHRESVDFRCDQYSLGVTLYELLAGRRPFPQNDTALLISAHLEEIPTPLSLCRPDLPAEVNNVVMKLLEKKPVDRYEDMAAAYAAWTAAVVRS